jgi:hypothetical protein
MTGISRLLTGFGAGDLFQLLRDGRPRTRSELASETGFAGSTIASRIDELLAAGLIASVGDAVSTGGRPSSRVALNASARLVAGAPAILHALADPGLDVQSLGDLADRVGTGDLVAVRTLREAGRNIGEVLTMCVSLINPSLIVVGGAMSRFSDLLIAGIRESVYARAMPLATRNLMIVESRVGARRV